MCFNALKGLPGNYVKHLLKKAKPDDLFKMLHGFEDKTAKALCVIAYVDKDNLYKPLLFHGITNGLIVKPRGKTDNGAWDPIF